MLNSVIPNEASFFRSRFRPGSRTAGVRGEHNGSLKVSVTVAPEKGKANQAVIKLLADTLQIPRSAIEVVAGATSVQKQILISGCSVVELKRLLDNF